MAKTIILLFVVFFALTVTLGDDWQQNNDLEINVDLKQLALEADQVLWKNPLTEWFIQNIQDLAKGIVNGITDQVQSANKEAHHLAKPLVQKAMEMVKLVADAINSKVNEAKGLNLNTTECVGFAIENVTNIPSKIEQDINECIDNTTEAARKAANDMIDKIGNAANTIVNELENNCSLLNLFGCLSVILSKGSAELLNLSVTAGKDLVDVLGAIGNCGNNLFHDGIGQGFRIGNETINCLNNLINNSTNRC